MNTFTSIHSTRLPPRHDLSDEQWNQIALLLPEMRERGPRRGRPHVDIRRVMNSVLWVLHSGGPWNAMPEQYVSYQTAHRYYFRWLRAGVMSRVAVLLFDTDQVLARFATRNRATRHAQTERVQEQYVSNAQTKNPSAGDGLHQSKSSVPEPIRLAALP
jgi:transposase